MDKFSDREDAGRQLAQALQHYAEEHPIVLGLPRGGVPVAFEVARALGAPLDVWVVRKVGAPWQPELGVGAVAEDDNVYLSHAMLAQLGLSEDRFADAIRAKHGEVEERVRKFRKEQRTPRLRDRTVILVDDGIATGGTVRAAIHSVRSHAPRRLVLAVPVAAQQTVAALEGEVDELVALKAPDDLLAIGFWYDDFRQVPDEEVVRLLDRARDELPAAEYRPSGGESHPRSSP
ncbi:phosphoribosyltransferase [Persicimonas caeni]|uniref:Phosphoribosyltransferase n=1 Tax=Persicimonas caeni TaxID=2292766 RepID=A0A4Y6PQE4_PERCE|nr:phosphoribosyltransferase [Persicimonas caeni]QDG50538.1 phosphoribosyltransferase [Persicimonas caeni]QED31759.1 phosphoribosyltransferase [Persicimonas caeni]